jgi:hypothetical protein
MYTGNMHKYMAEVGKRERTVGKGTTRVRIPRARLTALNSRQTKANKSKHIFSDSSFRIVVSKLIHSA